MTVPLRQRQIARATAFIEDRLSEPLTISRIARHICLSPFHFQRLFFDAVGESVSEYIKRRRLEKAANVLLVQQDLRLIDLALECGFETHSAFSRAFKAHFGLSPASFRSAHGNVRRGLGRNRPFLLANMNRPARVDADVTELPEMWMILRNQQGMDSGSFFPDKNAVQQQLQELQNQAGNELLFLVGAFREGPRAFTDPVARGSFGGLFATRRQIGWVGDWKRIKAGKWARIQHFGNFEHLYLTWNRACQNWLPSSGWRLRDDWAFETYESRPDIIDFSQPSAIVHMPIEANEE